MVASWLRLNRWCRRIKEKKPGSRLSTIFHGTVVLWSAFLLSPALALVVISGPLSLGYDIPLAQNTVKQAVSSGHPSCFSFTRLLGLRGGKIYSIQYVGKWLNNPRVYDFLFGKAGSWMRKQTAQDLLFSVHSSVCICVLVGWVSECAKSSDSNFFMKVWKHTADLLVPWEAEPMKPQEYHGDGLMAVIFKMILFLAVFLLLR